ncbi:MAG: hypothetical protein PUF62_03780 [Bacteroidales bacterium]|nr:hypothetical protein [Bacteroidales bacterium]
MEAIIRGTESGSGINTTDALWAIISAQPRKVRKELAMRLQDEFPMTPRCENELDHALKDVKEGRMSEPFNTPEELFKHLKI